MPFRTSIPARWLLAACLVPALHAQQSLLIDAPEPGPASSPGIGPIQQHPDPAPRLKLADWTLLGAAAALRSLDYQTTVKAMSDPANFHELILPQAIVNHHAALGAFEASTVIANYWLYRELVRHRHRGVARAGQCINLGALGGTVAFNEYNLAKYYPQPPGH